MLSSTILFKSHHRYFPFHSDLIQFSALDIQNNAYNFTFRNSLTRVPQVALGITHLATNSQNTLIDSNFGVFVSDASTRGVQIMLNSQGFAWIISRVSLWASTNSHIILGSSTMRRCVLMQRI